MYVYFCIFLLLMNYPWINKDFYLYVFLARHVAGRDNRAADAFSGCGFPSPVPRCLSDSYPDFQVVPVATVPSDLVIQCYCLLSHGLAPSTRRSYSSGQRCYARFCVPLGFPQVPASEWSLMLFATWLSQHRKLSPSTVSSYLAAVRSLHVDLGVAYPTLGTPRLHRLLQGIRHQGPHLRQNPRLAITNRVMTMLSQHLAGSTFNEVIFWAACCTAFFVFYGLVSSRAWAPLIHRVIYPRKIFHSIRLVSSGFTSRLIPLLMVQSCIWPRLVPPSVLSRPFPVIWHFVVRLMVPCSFELMAAL